MTKADNKREGLFEQITREAGYRTAIILDGNIRDLFDDGKKHYLPLPEVLLRRLADMDSDDGRRCFTICSYWDSVDGFTFAEPQMQLAFQRVLKDSACPDTDCGCPVSPSPDQDDGFDTPADSGSVNTGIFKQPQEAFSAMRKVLADESERPVFILGWQEYLVSDPSRHDLDERRLLTLLGKAIAAQPAGRAGRDVLKGPTGLLVIITSNLASLPISLYTGNPRTKVITVGKPDRMQRLDFLTYHQRDLQVAEPKPALGQPVYRYGPQDIQLSQMADLCDDLTTVDMQNVLALSKQVTPKMRPDRLLNFYKFGEQHSPWEDLDIRKLKTAENELKKRVIGQDAAIEAVVTILEKSVMGLAGFDRSSGRKKPKGCLLFVGPPGVGKTELANGIAAFVFGDENACIRIDMSEYSHEHDDQRLVGAPPGYVGFEQGGQLTNAVRQKPFSVVLLDEFEKAHGRIYDKFLQIWSDGRLTDGRGQTVYFGETLMIITSNIGSAEADPSMDPAGQDAHFKKMVSDHFRYRLGRPELLDRLGENNIVVFNSITNPKVKRKLLRMKLAIMETILSQRYELQLQVSDKCLDRLLSQSRGSFNGRELVNIVECALANPLSSFLVAYHHQLKPGRIVSVDVPTGQNAVKFEIRQGGQNEDNE